MKVVVPFATNSPLLHAVQIALRQDGVVAEYIHCSEDRSYYDLVYRLWAEGDTFCIVEHDIVVWPSAINELEHCQELWCTRPYYCSVGWIEDGLGCTKFDKQLMIQYPNFMSEPFPSCCPHTVYYCGLDRFIAHRMIELGIKPHIHTPGVSNLNDKWT